MDVLTEQAENREPEIRTCVEHLRERFLVDESDLASRDHAGGVVMRAAGDDGIESQNLADGRRANGLQFASTPLEKEIDRSRVNDVDATRLVSLFEEDGACRLDLERFTRPTGNAWSSSK